MTYQGIETVAEALRLSMNALRARSRRALRECAPEERAHLGGGFWVFRLGRTYRFFIAERPDAEVEINGKRYAQIPNVDGSVAWRIRIREQEEQEPKGFLAELADEWMPIDAAEDMPRRLRAGETTIWERLLTQGTHP